MQVHKISFDLNAVPMFTDATCSVNTLLPLLSPQPHSELHESWQQLLATSHGTRTHKQFKT